jgi:ornithine cyclodeaminase
MQFLSRADVRQAIGMVEAIEVVRGAFAQLASGEASVPLRTPVAIAPHEGLALFMPAYLARSQALGCKVVAVHPRNRDRGLPLVHALVVLVDAATGRPLAAIEGGYLTALRTGAGSGVATDLLARREARVLACFGAGVQARTQVEAVCAVRLIERVWVQSRSRATAGRFADQMRGRHSIPDDVRVADSPAQALAEADVVCTATTAHTPVFDGRDLRPGTHVNAVGAYTTAMREVDDEVVRRARIVVDARAGCQAEAGDLVIPMTRGIIGGPETWTEIGAILLGRAPGRLAPGEITLFKSVGNAAHDVAVGQRVLQRAESAGLGQLVDLGNDRR